ncbi:methyl-accepting chemotaxis protein [Sphingomonas hylomeconis]|uniref:Methyl-accepting chemotaxis protein n=1 Tax=Sphingomonas hylomeconis TaxID=1395958 RepID=A0ABV7SQS8_9SPHN|nr:methyl-accepting chemotaxis protein [Sphingomonas hylomeconis]
MNAFANLKIAAKIAALMLMLGAVTMALVLNGSSRLQSVSDGYADLVEGRVSNALRLADVSRLAGNIVYNGYKTMAYDGRSKIAVDAAEKIQQDYAEARKSLREVASAEPANAAAIANIDTLLVDLADVTSRAARLGLANDNEQARTTLARADLVATRLHDELQQFIDSSARSRAATSSALRDGAASTSRGLILLGLAGIAVAIGTGVFLTRRTISGPLVAIGQSMRSLASGNVGIEIRGNHRRDEVGSMATALEVLRGNAEQQARDVEIKRQAEADLKMVIDTVSSHLEMMAKGDLTRPIAADFPESYAGLKRYYNGALSSLRELIGAVSESSRSIAAGSREIEQASEDLARRTEASAASLEETSAAVTQINDRLRKGADDSQRTVERADQAIATVGSGRGTAGEAVQAMHRVADSAKGIDSVIEGLDKIAFQTRVLAMNAAVEAGRAGESGRGFAVVADLVGQLAMRSEEEARHAREQLTTTQNDVGLAVEAVQKVDNALVAISRDVTVVHELLGAMSTDNVAQAAAIEQISSAIQNMDQATQQNAAMVEEASAAARNLNGEVTVLTHKTSAFVIDQGARAAPPALAAPGKASVSAPGHGGHNGAVRPAALRNSQTVSAAAPAAPVAATQATRSIATTAQGYLSPVKPLPAAALPALVRSTDDWDEF